MMAFLVCGQSIRYANANSSAHLHVMTSLQQEEKDQLQISSRFFHKRSDIHCKEKHRTFRD